MELRNLGRSGLQVSVVGLGCNNFGGRTSIEDSRVVIHAALDHGITLFDTADIYGNRGGSEEALGRWLGTRRKDIVLASKFGMAMDDEGHKIGGSRRYMMQAVEDSLRRLKTDWIDLYQFHRPDPATPIEETLRALDDLVRQGKVRYIGCSNMPAWQLVDAQWQAQMHNLTGFVSAQDEYSLLHRAPEKDLLPALKDKGLGLLPYYPLASGLLSGKYRRDGALPEGARLQKDARSRDRYMTAENWTRVEKLEQFARERGHHLLELAFSWLAAQAPVASVIAGATRPEQIAANVAAAQWKLGKDELAQIDSLSA